MQIEASSLFSLPDGLEMTSMAVVGNVLTIHVASTPCIPSSVNATAPRKCRNQEQNHPFCERMSEVATTGTHHSDEPLP